MKRRHSNQLATTKPRKVSQAHETHNLCMRSQFILLFGEHETTTAPAAPTATAIFKREAKSKKKKKMFAKRLHTAPAVERVLDARV